MGVDLFVTMHWHEEKDNWEGKQNSVGLSAEPGVIQGQVGEEHQGSENQKQVLQMQKEHDQEQIALKR